MHVVITPRDALQKQGPDIEPGRHVREHPGEFDLAVMLAYQHVLAPRLADHRFEHGLGDTCAHRPIGQFRPFADVGATI